MKAMTHAKNSERRINVARKAANFIVLFFALAYYLTNLTTIASILLAFMAVFIPLDLLHHFSKKKWWLLETFFNLYPKRKEEYASPISDASILLISTFLLVLVFPKAISILGMILLTFVDIGEHVFGILLPSKKLFWNKDKNWSGTLAGFFIAIMAGYLAASLMKFDVSLFFILVASFAAALAGTAKKNDNIVIEWSSSVVLFILLFLAVL